MLSDKFQIKGVVLGDSSVGKTCLIDRFVKQEFSQYYKTTIGADFLSKELMINERHISFQIWDTAGQERFKSLGMAFYRGADCCLLVYDISDKQSFDSIVHWKSEFLKQSNVINPESFPFVILGNKSDLEEERQVPYETAVQWADENEFKFFEVSAKNNIDVDKAFIEAARLALLRENTKPPKTASVSLMASRMKRPKKKCCSSK